MGWEWCLFFLGWFSLWVGGKTSTMALGKGFFGQTRVSKDDASGWKCGKKMVSQIKFRDQIDDKEITRFGRNRQWGRKRLLICQPYRVGPRVKISQLLYLVLLLTIWVKVEHLFHSLILKLLSQGSPQLKFP